MGNSTSSYFVGKSPTFKAGSQATEANTSTNATSSEARRPRTAIAAVTGQLAVGTSHGLETGLKKAAAPVSLPDVIIEVPSVLAYLSKEEAKDLFCASTSNGSIKAEYVPAQLMFLVKNEELPENGDLKQYENRRYLPTVDKLKANLKLLGETHPDKSMSRHALASLVALNELNKHPDSETIPSHRLGALALATLEHLNDGDINDGDIDHINIKTELNPDQLQQVIDLLATLPAAHPERTKIDRFVTYLTHKRECILDIQNNTLRSWSLATREQIRVDYDVAMAAVQEWGMELRVVGRQFQANREIVLTAVRKNPWALQFASKALQADPVIVRAAVEQEGLVLKYASKALRNDFDVVLAAVQENVRAFQYASLRLQANAEVRKAAGKQSV